MPSPLSPDHDPFPTRTLTSSQTGYLRRAIANARPEDMLPPGDRRFLDGERAAGRGIFTGLRAQERAAAARRLRAVAGGRGAHVAPRPRGAGRPRAQAMRSGSRSGDSGDDGPPGETPRLEVVQSALEPTRPRGAVYAFACLAAAERGAEVSR